MIELKSSLAGSETSTPKKPPMIQEITGRLLDNSHDKSIHDTSKMCGTPDEESPSNVFEAVLSELKEIFVTKALQQADANTAFDARIVELESLLAVKSKEINQVRSHLGSQILLCYVLRRLHLICQ